MKFIVDAQLPRSLAQLLRENGHDAIHTLDLPERNATGDNYINAISIREERIVISKDADFFTEYFIRGQPFKLVLVTTGNIRNKDLLNIFNSHISLMVEFLEYSSVLELSNENIVVIV
jgi:predicted nuclease of predicted toxin-antitoxin system